MYGGVYHFPFTVTCFTKSSVDVKVLLKKGVHFLKNPFFM